MATEEQFDTKAYTAFVDERNKATKAFIDRWTFYAAPDNFESRLAGLRSSEGDENLEVVEYFENYYVAKHRMLEFRQLQPTWQANLRERMRDERFARGAFLYEMLNREWYLGSILADHDVIETFSRLGIPFYSCDSIEDLLEEAGLDPRIYAPLYRDAAQRCRDIACERGW